MSQQLCTAAPIRADAHPLAPTETPALLCTTRVAPIGLVLQSALPAPILRTVQQFAEFEEDTFQPASVAFSTHDGGCMPNMLGSSNAAEGRGYRCLRTTGAQWKIKAVSCIGLPSTLGCIGQAHAAHTRTANIGF
jgi:hypothetical protein